MERLRPFVTKGLTVNGDKVQGWKDAMTMSYPEVLKKAKAGDTIIGDSQ